INYFNPDSESKRDSNNSQRRIGEKLRDFHQGKNFQKISFEVLEYFEESTSDEEIIDFETKSKKIINLIIFKPVIKMHRLMV
ncbi:MAG: hypothetical protein ACTIN8_01350, partial [Pseudolactococcus laudensis]